MSPELKTVLRLINEQTAMLQALVSVLAYHGVIEPSEVKLKHKEILDDPQRAFAIFQTFRQYLAERV